MTPATPVTRNRSKGFSVAKNDNIKQHQTKSSCDIYVLYIIIIIIIIIIVIIIIYNQSTSHATRLWSQLATALLGVDLQSTKVPEAEDKVVCGHVSEFVSETACKMQFNTQNTCECGMQMYQTAAIGPLLMASVQKFTSP